MAASASGVALTTLSGCLNQTDVGSFILPDLAWNFGSDGEIIAPPTVSDGVIYAGSWDGRMYALEGEESNDNDGQESDYRTFKYDNAGTSAPETTGPKGEIAERWRFETDGLIFSTPLVDEGSVYFGSEDNNFYSVSVESGEENWRFRCDGMPAKSGAIVDDVVYVPAGFSGKLRYREEIDFDQSGALYAIDTDTGEQLWKTEREEGIQSAPKVHDGILFHGCLNSNFYAVDIETGEDVWVHEGEDKFCGGSPVLNDGTIYVGSEDHRLYALDAEDGTREWRFETGDIIVSTPVVTDEAVYFGSHDHNVYALDPDTGEEKWRFEAGGIVAAAPAYRDGVVYVGATDDHLYALDASTGEIRWRYETDGVVYGGPTVTENTIYFGSMDQNLYAVQRESVDRETYEGYRSNMTQAIEEDRVTNFLENTYADDARYDNETPDDER